MFIYHIDHYHGDLLNIMPESFVMIPFEIFKAFKRASITLYETQEEKNEYRDEYEEIYFNEEMRKTGFAKELMKYIVRHF